ncbi:hypothetical protein SASPL_132685 [Salvia splendens]|uniref:Uncharacterized protein n=1 Tax=Salvia splendens TaxID=180675 RepID=A0A8X8ZHR0_SALSN|nr:hypothetical protein SASPL_132685 [Salvia splendens]
MNSLGMAPVISLVGFGLLDRGFPVGSLSDMFTNENSENIVLLGSTRVGSRCVIQISAGFMIFFASR